MSRHVLLCADDFGADAASDAAMLRLAGAGRLTGISCLTDAPGWRERGRALCEHAGELRLGLHFNLTHPFGYGERPLAEWIVRSVAGRVHRPSVRGNLERQLDKFMRIAGRLPDYIDGHHHVHAFPRIRAVLHDAVAALTVPVPVRMVTPFFGPTDAPWKRRVIAALAATGPPVELEPSLRLNAGFAGDYSLRDDAAFEALMAGWLAAAPAGGLIMCHPGGGAGLAPGRAGGAEYDFLMSERFMHLVNAERIELRRPKSAPVAV